MGPKTCVQLQSYIGIKPQINTHILGGKLWCKRGRQVDGLVVVVVPDAPTHHTFDGEFLLLVGWCSLPMGTKTYIQLQSYIDIKPQINTHILGGKLWSKRGKQVDGIVVDVPEAPTHHTFDGEFVL
jgi:hypothetical protein